MISSSDNRQFLWVEKYRPDKVSDCILPKHLLETFSNIVAKGDISNLLLCGSAGVGKTTVAKALCKELNCDFIMINGSMNGNIDTLRNDIQDFASTVSLSGGKKVVILDEADNLNPVSFQPALRGFIEEYARQCRFILTCNYPNKIIPPLHSRCSVIDFTIPNAERKDLVRQIISRLASILHAEKVQFDPKVLMSFVVKNFPDIRRIMNELQRSSFDGQIEVADLSLEFDEHLADLLKVLREKDFRGMQNWVVKNMSAEENMYGKLYSFLSSRVKKSSVPQLVIHCHDFDYQNAFSTDKALCLTAALVNIMADVEFED